jgi:alkyl sulfatase BDS1-like metallo-beta-lactamase superfamily hydrolase
MPAMLGRVGTVLEMPATRSRVSRWLSRSWMLRYAASALRSMGQLSTSSIGRAFLISEARALEGKERIPLVVPNPEGMAGNPAAFVNYNRVRLDPRKSENVDKVIAFTFGDKTVGLHVRRGVAEFVPDPAKHWRKADVTLSMDGPTWAKLALNQIDLKSAVDSGAVKAVIGDMATASELLDLFDRFEPTRSIAIPSVPCS